MKILLLLFILLFILKIYEPKLKGFIGERRVNKQLEALEGYKLLKDVMLTTDNGTTQIDHILIGTKGIFVIETKNYDGWIFGNENSQYWTQVIYKSKQKFYNPIRQNKGHVKAIKNHISDISSDTIHSVIVFTDKSNFKSLQVTTPVIHLKGLGRYIKSYETNVTLSESDIINVCDILTENNITNIKERKNHVKRIRDGKRGSKKVKIYEEKLEITVDSTNSMTSKVDDKCQLILREDGLKVKYKALKQYRLDKAREESVKPYLIFSNEMLDEVIRVNPRNKEALLKIRGFGVKKVEKYGEDIIRLVRE